MGFENTYGATIRLYDDVNSERTKGSENDTNGRNGVVRRNMTSIRRQINCDRPYNNTPEERKKNTNEHRRKKKKKLQYHQRVN